MFMSRRAAIIVGIEPMNLTNSFRHARKSGIPLIAVKEYTNPWQHVPPF
jgi:hypothetical protein